MKYRTAERLGVGTIVVVVLLNIAFFVALIWVAWHFISKFW